MNKFRVFLASGANITIVAKGWVYNSDIGLIKFVRSDDSVVALFPPGGWHGVQELAT